MVGMIVSIYSKEIDPVVNQGKEEETMFKLKPTLAFKILELA